MMAAADDFEVLHAERVYPDGDEAAQIREHLLRVLRQAELAGMCCFVQPAQGGHAVSVLPAPVGAA